MSWRRPAALAALTWLGVAGCHGGPRAAPGTEALVGATLIDVVSGREIPDAVLLVHEGRLVGVGDRTTLPVPRGAIEVDLTGRWIVPGFVDAHSHLPPWGAALSLRWGVTTVRDLHATATPAGGPDPVPRRFAAGAMLDGSPATWPGAHEVQTPDDVARALDALASQGATWVKAYLGITPPLLEAIVSGARARRMAVAAHLGLTDALTAVRIGVASIEHLSGIPEAAGDSAMVHAAYRRGFGPGVTAFGTSWLVVDSVRLFEVARELASTGVTLVPTLSLHEVLARLDDPAMVGRGDLALVPDSVRREWDAAALIAGFGWDAATLADLRSARRVQDAFVAAFAKAGGRIAAGSDAANPFVVPGVGVHQEMELLVAAGLSPLEALRAASLRGADLLRADTLGRLRTNTTADLVVLSANPLQDIRNTRRVERVMLGGRWVEP